MGWKNWPYWLRGGIIGLGIGILFDILALALQLIYGYNYDLLKGTIFEKIMLPFFIIMFWIGVIIGFIPLRILDSIGIFPSGFFDDTRGLGIGYISGIIILPIICFLIGAIIGWRKGKVKSRKNLQEEVKGSETKNNSS